MFELRDLSGTFLAGAEERDAAERMLRAMVATAPGREEEIFLVTLGPDGAPALREDIFDL